MSGAGTQLRAGNTTLPLHPFRCDDIPDESVEVLVLRGLLTAATSATFSLHNQVRALVVALGARRVRCGHR